MSGGQAAERHWRTGIVLLWLAACGVMLWYRWGGVQWFALGDTDDNIRFAQVRDWLGGQGWFDLRQYHLDPPRGASIHWSRLVDLPIAGLILTLRPLLGSIEANKWAVAIAPLLPMLPALFGAALVARRLVAPGAWAIGAAFALCGSAAVWMWMPTRIDHHGWQLAFLILTLAGVADPKGARGGAVAGLASAASLAIGLEMLPYLGLTAAALVLRWIVEPGEGRRLAAYGAALAAGTSVGWFGFASYDNRAPLCDALTPVWLSDVLLGGALAVALAAVRSGDARVRAALAVAAGAAVAGFHAAAWPQCLGRPENVSPELVRLWLGNVKEAKPIYQHAWRIALPVVPLPLSGIAGALWATWAARGTPRFMPWVATALVSVTAALLLLWQMRAGPAAQLLAVPGATALAWAILPRLSRHRWMAVRVAGTAAAFIALSGLWTSAVIQWAPAEKPRPRAGVKPGQPDRSRFCGTLLSLRPVARLPRATILTFVDFGPRLIATTHHSAVAGPYHRNGPAILDVQHAFRGDAANALATIRRHGATYILTCPGMAESTIYAAHAPKGFYMMLADGRAPGWAVPVPLPPKNPLRLWRVAP